MDGLLIINPRSGDERPSAEELQAEAERRGIAAHVLAGEDTADVARGSGAEILGVAGGDGSIGPVAEVAVERAIPLVVVPFGTRNHFARDLGLDPDDPVAALAAFEGAERRVDAGRVNGRLFVNNVSLGPYARFVDERRLRALLDAALHPRGLIVVSNNAYRLDVRSFGRRDRLDEGLLHLYEARGLRRKNWIERSGTSFRVDARRRVRAAVDGEPARLNPPLEFRVDPGALRVLLPGEPGA